jgi:phosphatidylserine decarboxylase
MKIHREGYRIISVAFITLVIVAFGINLFFPVQTAIHYMYYLGATFFFLLVLRFFRDPARPVSPDSSAIISGADGRVVVIEEVEEKEFFNDRRRQVSVFMSPLDVHVNWFPVSGTVKYMKHNQGGYLVASHPKSSIHNERTTLVIENDRNDLILIRQIAGTVARRIVCYGMVGHVAQQGEELGIIKFGSRYDIFLPLDAEVKVTLGQKVRGCETVIARLGTLG